MRKEVDSDKVKQRTRSWSSHYSACIDVWRTHHHPCYFNFHFMVSHESPGFSFLCKPWNPCGDLKGVNLLKFSQDTFLSLTFLQWNYWHLLFLTSASRGNPLIAHILYRNFLLPAKTDYLWFLKILWIENLQHSHMINYWCM